MLLVWQVPEHSARADSPHLPVQNPGPLPGAREVHFGGWRGGEGAADGVCGDGEFVLQPRDSARV